MTEIDLYELPKSGEFVKHVRIADGLTQETGFEHGFIFCERDDKILIDKMCIGDKCKINVAVEKCNEIADGFHSHPAPSSIGSRFSIGDVYEVSRRAYYAKKSMIQCVKATDDNNVICQKVDPPSYDDLRYMNRLRITESRNRTAMNAKDFIRYQINRIDEMDKMNNASHIMFDVDTGETVDISSDYWDKRLGGFIWSRQFV